MSQKTMLKIEMVSTGDEVLYGQIVDSNAKWLSEKLFQDGFLITSRTTIGDNLETIVSTLKTQSLVNDILIINGGLGPTSDDLTSEAAAIANNEPLILNETWVRKLTHYYASRGKIMPPSNKKQALLPKSATIIDNPIGTACGFSMIINNCLVFFTPGVPSEFKEMVRTSILPQIKFKFPKVQRSLCYRLTTMGRSESDLATEIEKNISLPENISIGYRAAMPIVELKLTGPQSEKNTMDIIWEQLKTLVNANMLYEGILTRDTEFGLAKMVSGLLHERSLTIAVIEQQTAGYIGYQLFESEAPILKSEVVPFLVEETHKYFLDFLTKTKANIAIGMVNFKERNSQFTLIIADTQKVQQFNLKYTGRSYNRKTELTILSAIALDGLRRYFMNLPIIGNNIWLEVIK